jgi:hypothetical protein
MRCRFPSFSWYSVKIILCASWCHDTRVYSMTAPGPVLNWFCSSTYFGDRGPRTGPSSTQCQFTTLSLFSVVTQSKSLCQWLHWHSMGFTCTSCSAPGYQPTLTKTLCPVLWWHFPDCWSPVQWWDHRSVNGSAVYLSCPSGFPQILGLSTLW